MKLPLPFNSRDKFLVLDATPQGVHGLFLSVDEEHALVIEKYAPKMDLEKYFGRPWRRATQQAWEGEYLFKDHRKVIAVADPALATTVSIPVTLVREALDAKHAITVPELENLIAQEMAKIFNACRAEAAARLGVHELDAVLVGEKGRYFKVDGEAVANPAGFAGKKVTLLLELTFATRGLFEQLSRFFNAPDDFYFAEAPMARLTAIARVRDLPLALAAAPSLFALKPLRGKEAYPILAQEPFSWSFEPLFGRIQEEFGVGRAAAEALYHMYVRGEFSDHAARAFKRAIDPEVAELLAESEKKKCKGSMFIDAPYRLPFETPYRHGDAVFEDLPLGEVLKSVGFTDLKGGEGVHGHALSRHLLPFIEAYYDKSNTEINQKLRRRLHWLAA